MPRRALAITGAACGAGLLILTWLLAYHVGIFERADQSIYSGFGGLRRPHVDPIARFIAGLCDPIQYLCFSAIPPLIAGVRRRRNLALASVAIMVGANVTTELLKLVLAHPRAASLLGGARPVGSTSWPSGHATAAMALALSLILVVPARLRPLAAGLGALFATAVSYSFLTLGWHYPSDVFGGFLVAGIWASLALVALSTRWDGAGQRLEEVDSGSVRKALTPPAAVALGALGVAGLIALTRPHAVLAYAQVHTAFMVGAASIGALGLALATGLMLAFRR
jgi:membrane-associated phospholipid phosphatase